MWHGAWSHGHFVEGRRSCRRNYRGLFDDVARSKELTRSPHFTLRLIGKGDLAIPAALKAKVTKETNLPYEV